MAVSVKMTEEDFKYFQSVANTVWKGALMSNASIILSLARVGAETLLKRTTRKK